MLSTTSKTPTAIPQDVKCVVERLLKTKRTLPPVPATTRVGNDLGDAASGIAFSTGPREEAESSSFGKRAEFAVYGWGINEAWTDSESEGDGDVQDIQFLAEGGYNRLWTVTTSFGSTTKKFILRMPMEDALLPHQLLNEVAFLAYVASNLPRIPVPRVYAFDAGTSLVGVPFIAEEFVEGVRLDEAWSGYDDREKDIVARRLAEMVVDMATTTFPGIGGLTLQHELGPTVEGMKLFGGRDKFHSQDCYNIGPYLSTQEYVVACYEKEIYYYTHAAECEIDNDLFANTPLSDFIQTLRETRDALMIDASIFPPEEPFVLVHGDFHGRNIIVKGTDIAAVIDWEFAGAYPMSELLGDEGIDLVECYDTPEMMENSKWCARILRHVKAMVIGQGWPEQDQKLLLEGQNEALQWARCQMMPRDCSQRVE